MEIILENRCDFINEIKTFISSNDIMLKIFGCDDIGKSLTFLYLTLLINEFKIIYFNLKEIKQSKDKLKTIEYQLMQYFSSNTILIKNKEDKEKISKYYYQMYKMRIELLEKKFSKYSDFWDIFEFLIEKNDNNLEKLVYIIDQYKLENDPLNKIEIIKKIINEKKINIKIIISFSLNDTRVKTDFIGTLNNFKEEQNVPNQGTNDIDTIISEKYKNIFDEYSPEKDYINDMELNDKVNFKDYFPKIKIFKENIYPKKEENNFPQKNTDTINIIPITQKVKIKYLNDLITLKKIGNEKEELLSLLANFNYNPKYYYKLKNFSKKYDKVPLNELYQIFYNK